MLRGRFESVRFRGHQAEVAMITITACSYLTLVDPYQQQQKKWYYEVGVVREEG